MRILNNVNQVYSFLNISKTSNSLPIESICINSQQASKHSLFFGLPGKNTDGSKYFEEALSKKAALCIIKPGFTDQKNHTALLERKDVLFTMTELSKACRQSFGGKVIGITGSNGKTTTKEILKQALPNIFATEGNLNNEIGVPFNILNLEDSHHYAAIEMGAAKMGDIKYLSSIALQDIGVITSIGRSHISGFGSVEAILEEKAEIIKNLPTDGLAVVPFGQYVDFWNSVKTSEKLVTFGLNKGADYCFELVSNDTDKSQQKIEVFIKRQSIGSFYSNLMGAHNALNLGAAFAVCHNLGLQLEEFSHRLEELSNIHNRLGLAKWINDSTIIDDTYNANPDSTIAALRYLASFSDKKKIAVLGDMLELGKDSKEYHTNIGEMAKALDIDILLGFGEFMQYAVESFGSNGIFFKREAGLIDYLKEHAAIDKVFLLKGSRGMKMERFKII